MEQRLANTWKISVNEKNFIETALLSDLRIDGRRPFDYRTLDITFGKEDGAAEVQLGKTHVMGFVTAQLVAPYKDRPNEGTLSIFTEFSPMADPSFEAGRPGESAIELGRVVDRGLRESRAVDTESLCVVAGKYVWSIRIDLHIIDNGGNLVDAANVAALASLSTFRRPECTLGGEDGQEVIVHPLDVKEPLPLIIHHLPIAITFAFFGKDNTVVIDPSQYEEAVMGGRMTVTLNTNGEICAIQKAGGEGIIQSSIMQCLRIASVKAGDVTNKIKNAVESFNTERALRKIKRHVSVIAVDVSEPLKVKSADMETLTEVNDMEIDKASKQEKSSTGAFIGGPSSWDPCSKGVDSDALRASLASSHGGSVAAVSLHTKKVVESRTSEDLNTSEANQSIAITINSGSEMEVEKHEAKTLADAVKPKHKRKKKNKSSSNAY